MRSIFYYHYQNGSFMLFNMLWWISRYSTWNLCYPPSPYCCSPLFPHNNGASPPAGDPPVNISWTDGQNETTRARFLESQRRRAKFGDWWRDWWNKEVLRKSNGTCSESIFAHSYYIPPTLAKVTPTESTLTVGWYNIVAMSEFFMSAPICDNSWSMANDA